MVFNPELRPEAGFPYTKKIGGLEYRLSPINPYLVKNCTKATAVERSDQIRKEGWATRVVAIKSPKGTAYVVYERRTGREMSKAQNILFKKAFGGK